MPADRWLGRETEWDYYYLRSSETYEDAWHTSFIDQGYAYEYYWGLDIAYRDVLMAALPLAWLDPALARQILVFGLQAQPRSGDIPCGFVNGTPFDLSPGYRADAACRSHLAPRIGHKAVLHLTGLGPRLKAICSRLRRALVIMSMTYRNSP